MGEIETPQISKSRGEMLTKRQGVGITNSRGNSGALEQG
jgi:hypothetical protein